MKKGVFIFWSIFISVALARLFNSFYTEPPDIGKCVKQQVHGEGIVMEEPERKESGQVFVIEADFLEFKDLSLEHKNEKCAENIKIRLKTKLYPRFSYGNHILFSGKLSQPFNFKSNSGRFFDYKGYLAKDEVFYEIKSAQVDLFSREFEKVGKHSIEDITNKSTKGLTEKILDDIYSILFKLKRRFVSNLESVLGDPHSALAAGLVVGEKSALGKNLIDDFRTVGLIHIVVLSGFNITIVADALRRVLSFLPRVWGIIIGGIGIALFGIMTGGGATVVRSCFMAGVALSADLIRRDYNVIRALIFAALLMLIQNPMILLHDPSFQLSFLATLGLILLSGPIEERLGFITDKFGIRGIISATLSTQIFVSPYILYMMGQLSLIGAIANILVLPFIPITMLAVFLTGVTGFIWTPISQAIGWVTHLLLSYELLMVESFARLPFASINLPAFSFWWVVGFYGVIGGVFYGRLFLKDKFNLVFRKNRKKK